MTTTIPEAAIESVARTLAMSDALSRGEVSDWANASTPEREWWMNRADDLLQAALPHLIGPFAAADTDPEDVAKAVALSEVIRAVPDDDLAGDVSWKLTAAIVKAGPFVMDDEAELIANAVLASGHVMPVEEVERSRTQVAAIQALHHPIEVEPSATICAACSTQRGSGDTLRYFPFEEWPCDTIAALDAPHTSNTPPRVEAEDAVSAETRHGRDSARPAAVGGGSDE